MSAYLPVYISANSDVSSQCEGKKNRQDVRVRSVCLLRLVRANQDDAIHDRTELYKTREK